MYFLYIIKCSDGSLYTGITTDVMRRFAEHKEGKGARYTRSRKVMAVVHIEKYKDRSSATKREAEVKKLTKIQKLNLIGLKMKKITKENTLPKLAAPALRALSGAGIKTIRELSKWKEEELLELHGMGQNAIKQIKAELKSEGLSLK